MKWIDLRSDTVTKPTLAMRQAMFEAQVGDDVMGEDPTMNALEAHAAAMLGFEDALFVTSGTQGNLLSVMAHCDRGEELIVGRESHIFRWEAGGSWVLGSVSPCPIPFEQDGSIDLEAVRKAIKPDDVHFPKTKLLALENTHGGKVLSTDYLARVSQFAKDHSLSTHLDGARVFNAAVSLGVPIKKIAQHFDSVTFCLSKGLGAPVGSLICSSKPFIQKARRLRKMVGGGLRQAGSLAAAGLYALNHHVERLAHDHANAAKLAAGLSALEQLNGKVRVHTNMVFVDIGETGKANLPSFMHSKGIHIFGGETLRLVTHLDVSSEDIDKVLLAFHEFYMGNARFVKTDFKTSVY